MIELNLSYPCLIEQDAYDPTFWNATLDVDKKGDVWMVSAPSQQAALVEARKLLDFYVKECWRENVSAEPRAISAGWTALSPSLPLQAALLLRQLRRQSGLSQADLASKVGVSQQVYARLESPQSNATLSTLEKVSRDLGVNMTLEGVRYNLSQAVPRR